MWQVFNDCIEMFALSIQNTFCFGQTFEKNENRYKDITKNYSESEIETIVKIFAEITNALEANPFQDFLGDLYMQLDMGSSALGQFFTPYTVSYAMAESSFDEKNAKAELSQKGYISVLEPTVGGGANDIENFNPACRMCNFYKSTRTVEDFKKELGKLLSRLEKVFIFRLAVKYGLIKKTDNPIEFYFEKQNKTGKESEK